MTSDKRPTSKRGTAATRDSVAVTRFRSLADAMPQLCWIAKADGWIFWYNRRWYEYTGTAADEMKGWGWQSVHDPSILPVVMERWKASIATGQPFDMVFPLRRYDGVFRHFLTRIVPLRDQQGNVVRWFGTSTDVTEQRETEEAFHQSNVRLNLLAQTASELLATKSPQGVVNSICSNVMAFLDCQVFFNFLIDEEQQRLHLNTWAGIDVDEAKRIEWLDVGMAVCGCAAEGGCRVVAEDVQNTPDQRTTLVRTYGVTAYACHPMMAQGRVLGTLSFGTRTRTRFSPQDLALMKTVTDQVAIAMEQKRMEEMIRRSEARLEAFLDASPGMLSILDEELRYLKTDRVTPTYFGLDRDSIIGRSVGELSPEHLHSHGAMMRRVLETGEPELNAEVQSPIPSRPGEMAHWLASYFPVPLPGGKGGVGVMGVEITDKKEAEEALRRAHDELEQRVQERTEELAKAMEAMRQEIVERQRAEESLRRLNRLYLVLSETGKAIVRASDRTSLFRDFCRIATNQGGFLLAWVGLVEKGGRIRVAAASGATAYLRGLDVTTKKGPDGEGPTGIAVRGGAYYICNDFQNDPCTLAWHERGEAFGIRASASVVLKEEGRVFGALTLYSAEKDFFDGQHVALLQQMGADLSFAVDNLLREERRREAERALQEETLERLRATEALREKERLLIQQNRQAALGEMINNIAHQWRQPLNALGLMIQDVAMSYEVGDLSSEYLDNSVNSFMQIINHMSQTIDDFRNFFRPEKEKVAFRLSRAVSNVTSIMDASLKAHRIHLEVATAGDAEVHGYPNEFSQVLLNIMLNARDVLTERQIESPRIEVLLSQEEDRGIVIIRDNGGGIPEEIIDKIFDPYFTTKGPDKGTGIGLYMSKAIIEKNMNGRMTARNSQDGAEFRIEV